MPAHGFGSRGRDAAEQPPCRFVSRTGDGLRNGALMSINKRNIDTDELAKPSQGTAMPSGTGKHDVHRREAERAAQDPRLRGAEGRKTGTLGRAELGRGTIEA